MSRKLKQKLILQAINNSQGQQSQQENTEQFENIDCFEQKLIIKLLKLERKINNMEKSFLNKEYVEKYEYNHKILEIQDRITYIENNYHH